MKKIILYIFLASIISCKKADKKETVRTQNINEVLEAILFKDKRSLIHEDKDPKKFYKDLWKQRIYFPEKRNDGLALPPPPGMNFISIEELLHTEINDRPFFTSKDSLYLIKQASGKGNYQIEDKLLHKINVTAIEAGTKEDKQLKEPYNLYQISVPFFSKDGTKAYVELDNYCGRLCGGGTVIYLSKINGEWVITDKWETWVS
jgi:hypothetical protein